MNGRQGRWGALILVAMGLSACGQPTTGAGTQVAADQVRAGPHGELRIQQNEGPSGRVICNRRYRNCLRTLVPEMGDAAMRVCEQRRDSCIDALGEGYFYRPN